MPLQALEFVHSARIAHRDVQPCNVLLDEDCRVRLCDFSSAKHVADSVSTHGIRMSHSRFGVFETG